MLQVLENGFMLLPTTQAAFYESGRRNKEPGLIIAHQSREFAASLLCETSRRNERSLLFSGDPFLACLQRRLAEQAGPILAHLGVTCQGFGAPTRAGALAAPFSRSQVHFSL